MLISPYFREKEIRNVFPMYHMSDYKVNYSNHKQFQAGMIKSYAFIFDEY